MNKEPALTLSAFLAVVVAGLGLLTEFGVDLTSGQQTAIVTFVAAVGAIATGFLIRRKVTPVAKLEEERLVAAAKELNETPAVGTSWKERNGEDIDPSSS